MGTFKHYLKAVVYVVALFLAQTLASQPMRIIDVSGRISDPGNESVEGAIVKIKSKDRATFANEKGLYNLIAEIGDTLLVYKSGYAEQRVVLSDTLDFSYVSGDFILLPDTIEIDPVTIFPWRTYEEFKQAFLSLKQKKDRDMENAAHNIALVKTFAFLYNEPDPARNFKYVMDQQLHAAENNGMIPTTQLFNPFAWVKLFQSIEDGSLFNSNDIPSVKEPQSVNDILNKK